MIMDRVSLQQYFYFFSHIHGFVCFLLGDLGRPFLLFFLPFLLPPASTTTPDAHALPASALQLRSFLTFLPSLAPFPPFALSLFHSVRMEPHPHAPPAVLSLLHSTSALKLMPLLKETGSNPSAGRFRPYASTKHRVTRGRYITSNDRRGYM